MSTDTMLPHHVQIRFTQLFRYAKQLNHGIDSYHQTMCAQALTFEQRNIRFPEDTPVVIPCLQRAMTIFCKEANDPYAFQALIFFFSSLLPPRPMYHRMDETNIVDAWEGRANDLQHPYRHVYRDNATCAQAFRVIEQLNPITTCLELENVAASYLRGDPKSGYHDLGDAYTIVNRGHDWIVRCAYESNIPDNCKTWLQLMYEKQPYKIEDVPSHRIDEGKFTFLECLREAANHYGFDGITPVTVFWVRQVLTLIDTWDHCLQVEGDQAALLPPYEWCVASYDKMWYQFQKDLRDPFSEYTHEIRYLLQNISYMRVFEECWQWIHIAIRGMEAEDFVAHEVRKQVYNHALTKVRDEFQSKEHSTAHVLKKTFGDQKLYGKYNLLEEKPVVYLHNLDDYAHLRGLQSLRDGLCKEFYPNLPNMTQAELDAHHPDSERDYALEDEADMDIDLREFELQDDVKLEACGPRIDITQLTLDVQPDTDDFCTFCQTDITLDDADEQRCVITVMCSHVFHAGCLDAWVNDTAETSNRCPNCQAQITWRQRPRRPIQ